ncbi:MAG: hypothetical protein RIQ94_559 [Pseudomonadota bacterium]|jgi:hypothetical protein
MPVIFPIERDNEFYVFLKIHLPSPFHIESEPSSAYYSEWMYCYKLYEHDRLLQVFEGDYRTINKGTLINEAMRLLNNLELGITLC